MKTKLALDTLRQSLRAHWNRRQSTHHGCKGSQYLSNLYTAYLFKAGINTPFGTLENLYDKAFAETTIIGLYQTEVLHHHIPEGHHAIDYATLEWVYWFNNLRLQEPIGKNSPR